MKNNIILRMTFLIVAMLLFTTCTKTYMEKAQDKYSASKIIPIVFGTSGPASVLKTFAFDYKITYDRAGSTWNWTATDATVQTVSADKKTATILFNTTPANDTALVKVTETTSGGVTSVEKVIKVKVNPFCPLPIAGFVGTWGGTDGTGTGSQLFPSQVVTSAPSGTSISVTGLNFGWIVNYWGETITAGGIISMTINANGTAVIPDQYCFTTDYGGSPYIYWVIGTGTWGNCGAKPTLNLTYNVYYKDGSGTLPSASTVFKATLVKN